MPPGSAAVWGHPLCPSPGKGQAAVLMPWSRKPNSPALQLWTRADFRYKKTEGLGQGCNEANFRSTRSLSCAGGRYMGLGVSPGPSTTLAPLLPSPVGGDGVQGPAGRSP